MLRLRTPAYCVLLRVLRMLRVLCCVCAACVATPCTCVCFLLCDVEDSEKEVYSQPSRYQDGALENECFITKPQHFENNILHVDTFQ